MHHQAQHPTRLQGYSPLLVAVLLQTLWSWGCRRLCFGWPVLHVCLAGVLFGPQELFGDSRSCQVSLGYSVLGPDHHQVRMVG